MAEVKEEYKDDFIPDFDHFALASKPKIVTGGGIMSDDEADKILPDNVDMNGIVISSESTLDEKLISRVFKARIKSWALQRLGQNPTEQQQKTAMGIISGVILSCAIRIAVIGVGKKNFGKFTINEKKVGANVIFPAGEIDIKGVFTTLKCKFSDDKAHLEPDDLTPSRVLRILKAPMRAYRIGLSAQEIKEERPYLCKYASMDDIKNFQKYLVRGAEHWITTGELDAAAALIRVHTNADAALNLKGSLTKGIVAVFKARKFPIEGNILTAVSEASKKFGIVM